jgi:hypothetical protein
MLIENVARSVEAKLLAEFNGRTEPEPRDRRLAVRLLSAYDGPLAMTTLDLEPTVESMIG